MVAVCSICYVRGCQTDLPECGVFW